MRAPGLFAALLLALVACRAAPIEPQGQESGRAAKPTPLAAGEHATLAFAPPPNRLLVEQSRVTRAEAPVDGAAGTRHEETITASLECSFEVADGGFTVLQRVSTLTVSRDGKTWEDPLVSLVTRFPMKLALSSAGEFRSLLNPEDAREAVKKTFLNPIERDTLLRYFTPEALETQARNEWNAKYLGTLGTELHQGSALYTAETIGMTTGQEVHYVMERRLVGTAPSPWGEALVFSVRCLAKKEEAQDQPALAKLLQDQPSLTPETTSRCEGQQIIAHAPFVPGRSWLSFRAIPEPKPDTPKLQVSLERDQNLITNP
jgi:hypothetical protein